MKIIISENQSKYIDFLIKESVDNDMLKQLQQMLISPDGANVELAKEIIKGDWNSYAPYFPIFESESDIDNFRIPLSFKRDIMRKSMYISLIKGTDYEEQFPEKYYITFKNIIEKITNITLAGYNVNMAYKILERLNGAVNGAYIENMEISVTLDNKNSPVKNNAALMANINGLSKLATYCKNTFNPTKNLQLWLIVLNPTLSKAGTFLDELKKSVEQLPSFADCTVEIAYTKKRNREDYDYAIYSTGEGIYNDMNQFIQDASRLIRN